MLVHYYNQYRMEHHALLRQVYYEFVLYLTCQKYVINKSAKKKTIFYDQETVDENQYSHFITMSIFIQHISPL